ncbi:ABC transporter substrate-binding protein [Limobrevibacterium gyesilva]|uniref:ABC transporter substrate-binding protein n=1 Tax=Limobrevibacterium gyesilva TaxID=2991712 RepID=A0AA41YSN7_9PROT|nr:ABC transporter substrate-binding protein [Limobrevibacterium gyesilva]MCW3475780.1 ABC transporter substrate-binding protein [Limobrevibacterium gyesilva]
MKRRTFLQATAAVLAAPSLARGAGANVLKFIPEGDLPVLDPVWTTATNARNHGYLVFDTLYGQDADYVMRPQMVAGHVIENDGRQWTITLRDGLKFHDGEPVRAVDAVASIRRFAARDAFGQALMDATDELSAVDDKAFRFRLKRPFPLLPNALGKTGTPMPCIMPERLAKTDPNKHVTEMVGSGPFRFKADERVPGSRVVYERFDGYVPRADGPATFTAGPKRVHFDRIEWITIPDSSTAASALRNGEVDWWQTPTPDLLDMLRRGGRIVIQNVDPAGGIGVMRFNFLYPPFDNPAIRRALLGAIDQADFMTAVAGPDPELWKDRVGVFSPGTPMANEAGIEVLSGKRDLDKVRRDLIAAGYKGEPVVLLGASDYPGTNALALVAADVLKRVGMNVDFQAIDWGTVVQRRASRQPPDKGGWNVFFTYLNGTNNFDPAGQLGIRGNGKDAWFGWPDMPKLEELRNAWFAAPDLAAQKQVCERIQLQVWQDVPFIPLGVYYQPGAWNKAFTGMRIGFPQFYDVRRA